MIIKYTQLEFNSAKSNDLLLLECKHCHNTFLTQKRHIRSVQLKSVKFTLDTCSQKCAGLFKSKRKTVTCLNCNKEFLKKEAELKRSLNSFCSNSCSALHQHKTSSRHGHRRSKLEIWTENHLKTLYPDLNIVFNNRTAIGLELDVYIPSLKLAIEINGIIHYKPIHGVSILEKVQNRDLSKIARCKEKDINLYIIDTQDHFYPTLKNSQKYLNIITNLIEENI